MLFPCLHNLNMSLCIKAASHNTEVSIFTVKSKWLYFCVSTSLDQRIPSYLVKDYSECVRVIQVEANFWAGRASKVDTHKSTRMSFAWLSSSSDIGFQLWTLTKAWPLTHYPRIVLVFSSLNLNRSSILSWVSSLFSLLFFGFESLHQCTNLPSFILSFLHPLLPSHMLFN